MSRETHGGPWPKVRGLLIVKPPLDRDAIVTPYLIGKRSPG